MNKLEDFYEHKDQSRKGSSESDTKKVIQEHLADPNHRISEEDIRNIEVGKSNPDDVITGAGAEAKANLDKLEDQHKDTGKRPNPWDVIGPTG